MVSGEDIRSNPLIEKHADWAEEIKKKYEVITKENVSGIVQDEIGLVFAKVLEHAGVYKRTEEGKQGFDRFVHAL